ncbi:MAG: hypothetical protein DSM106950_18025 [Stigonema ocellatum SAG 48.90 = DSM 106950]|nr:hypothetical protein [Stigonema ocellatum SAG 48.90 = DSM 106950]
MELTLLFPGARYEFIFGVKSYLIFVTIAEMKVLDIQGYFILTENQFAIDAGCLYNFDHRICFCDYGLLTFFAIAKQFCDRNAIQYC